MNFRFYFLLMILGVSFGTLKAQNDWDVLFAKSQKAYRQGKYAKALRRVNSVRRAIIKDYQNQEVYQVWCNIQAAKCRLALGSPLQAEEGLERAMVDLKTLSEPANACEVAKYQMAWAWQKVGNYRLADSLLQQVESRTLNEVQKAELELCRSELQLAYQDFEAQDIQIQNLQNTWQALALASEDTEGRKLKGYEKRQRRYYYGRSLTLQGEFARAIGHYDSAQNILQSHLPQLKSLGKKQISYAQHLLSIAQTYLEAEKPKLARRAFEFASRKVRKRHALYFEIREGLAKAQIADNKTIPLKRNLHFTKKLRQSYFRKVSTYQLRLELLNIEADIYAKKYQKARKSLKNLLERYDNFLPNYSPLRQELNEQLYALELRAETDLQNAQIRLFRIQDIIAKNYGKACLPYAAQRLRLADYYLQYTDSLSFGRSIVEEEAPQAALLANYTETHRNYVTWQNYLANYCDSRDDYQQGLELVRQGSKIYREKFGAENHRYGLQLLKQADFELKAGEFNAANASLNKAVEIVRQSFRRRSFEYANALTTSARLFNTVGSYTQAENLLRQASRIYHRLKTEDLAQRARSVEEAALIYIRIGEYAETERLLKEIVELKLEKYGSQSRQLIRPYKQLAYLYLIKGDYQSATDFLNKSLKLTESIYGNESLRTADIYEIYAQYYALLGDYESALQYMRQALAVKEQQLNNEHIELGKTYVDYALIMFYQNPNENSQKAKEMLAKAQTIMEQNFGKTHPLYAEVLKDLATIEIANTQYNQAFVLLTQANNIWKEKLGEDNINSAETSMLLGDIYTKLGRFGEAEDYYKTAERIYKSTFDENHPDYVRNQSKLGQMFFISGDYKAANKIYKFTTEAYLGYIDKYFPILSESEKANFWAKIRPDFEFYNTLAITQRDKRSELIENMYNFTLATKALLLSSSIKIREQILASEDETLRRTFQDWLDQKAYLNSLLAMTDEEQKEQGISVNDVQKEINRLEKELSERSALFNEGFATKPKTWEDVRKTLKEDEAAIEIIRFRVFEQGFTDKVRYAALIVQPKSRKAPDLVLLENGEDLENKFLKYYRNMVRYRQEDNFSYPQYWQAIADKLDPDIKTVYLSPDGVYNQINVESLMYEDGKYVIDRRNVRVVSNTKDLLEDRNRDYKQKTALLFGNPQFYTQSNAAQSQYISQLPGTEQEVRTISQMLQQAGWTVEPYLEQEASETKIKNTDSPRLCHIATHGMFQSDQRKQAVMIESKFKSDNPLMRSGILTKGAGDALAQKPDNYNQEGILTAYEALSLGLDQTELVVLSACETGRGDVQVGEGVYGLQRAFLVAGADAVVMSLFKVSDEVTTKLMVKFYEKWLASGDKRLAFNEAQKAIKAEYKHPAFWGVFNMIGVN